MPQNAGLTSRVRVVAPEGSLFNPVFPAALSARHLAVQRLSDVVIEALSELLPERSVAASHVSFPALVFQSVDPRSGRLTLIADILGGGGGARRGAPGDDGVDPYCSNCALLPAEIAELEYPWRIERTELVEGRAAAARSGAASACGATTGCCRTSPTACTTSSRPWPRSARGGREGGGPGAPGRAAVVRAGAEREEPLPGKGYVHLYRGDVFTLVGAGGGGFGAPGAGGAAPTS